MKRKHCSENGQTCKKAKRIFAEEFSNDVGHEQVKFDDSITITETLSYEDFLKQENESESTGPRSQPSKVHRSSHEKKKGRLKRKKVKSRKESTDDDVVYINSIESQPLKPLKLNQPLTQSKKIEKEPRNKLKDLSSLRNECVLWTDKFTPQTSQNVIGRTPNIEEFFSWLNAWKIKIEKRNEQELVKSDKLDKEKRGSDDEWLDEDSEDSLIPTAVIFGPTGCGKTAAVYACAKELNFTVVEMNASSLRNSKQVFTQLQEATQSHKVSKHVKSEKKTESRSLPNAFANFHKTTKKMGLADSLECNTDASPTHSGSRQTSLILLDEVDVLFESDKFFWPAVQSLMSETKRPIIMTTTDLNVLKSLEGKYETFHFKHHSDDQFSSCLKSIASNASLKFSDERDLLLAAQICNHDIRKCIHATHFWGCHSHDQMLCSAEHATVNKPSPHVSMKKSKHLVHENECDNKIKMKCQNKADSSKRQKPLDKSKESDANLVGFFDSICGIKDIINPNYNFREAILSNSHVHGDSNETMFYLLKTILLEPDNAALYVKLENALSSMYSFDLPQIVLVNFYNLLLCKTLPTPLSSALPIHVPSSYFAVPSHNTELMMGVLPNDYLSLVNGIHDLFQMPSDSFAGKNTADVCRSKSLVEYPKPPVTQKTSHKAKDIFQLSVISDTCSFSDQLHGQYLKACAIDRGNADENISTLRDGLLDTYGRCTTKLNYKMKSTLSDVQATVQTLLLKQSLSKLDEKYRDPTQIAIDTKAPDENRMRRKYQNQRWSLQSLLPGGNLNTRRSFILDFMPILRCVCRIEEKRKKAKSKRRFLHYLRNVNAPFTSSEIHQLQNDFKEIPL